MFLNLIHSIKLIHQSTYIFKYYIILIDGTTTVVNKYNSTIMQHLLLLPDDIDQVHHQIMHCLLSNILAGYIIRREHYLGPISSDDDLISKNHLSCLQTLNKQNSTYRYDTEYESKNNDTVLSRIMLNNYTMNSSSII
ncbi:MAG: hypothetical protein ACI8RD_006224 [Bacillariaceae sp.]|jgi:hypothetical protein